MASTIRFYMEQSVPELEDLERKGLFDKREITMIMRRRTDFEHRILGRGSQPRDFLKYSDFEINLERLRIKRFQRLHKTELVDAKPSISDWAGFRKIIFVFDRAVRRYPANLELWLKFLQFVKEKDAIKIVYRVYAKLLLLQPRNVEAWLSAAKYEFETNANAKGARDLYQRALKLNPESSKLWLSYAQFELAYVSKLLARRKVMGLLTEKQQEEDLQAQASDFQSRLAKVPAENGTEGEDAAAINNDVIAFDDDNEDEIKEQLALLPEADMNILGNPDLNPVLKGDIALTVFDVSIPELLKGVAQESRESRLFELAEQYLEVFSKFENLNRDYLNYHVVSYLQNTHGSNPRTVMLDITLPLRNVKVSDSNLAEALQLSVNKYMAYKLKTRSATEKVALAAQYVAFLNAEYVNCEEEKSERTVQLLRAIIQKCQ
ncbi:hypothetical protein METBIDRAFT_46348 [Metschnikowia bicuspidata var. bicuspidata NRRL YB-4993]|uniref:U3 small nucleolar RNA-associated protein 6 N-terminal domain-containing protein n=1 Tax=Metschnikowia bicuspidata var. bicuspidata NRRL YB-4993 TaxID=869754 RepID=A0A1A0H691_9ASCO|nr:hypothetical protein METBIDRAFT_46348 [Metschnikowia bicuspidata var. bicuspidata NRRL YB-4993]OBA19604.1 hypothetical protein METBIDRAFT_46348 [Metschnikowia bicuspidata var. bicuspidata NRRL YB-4993]